VASFKKWNADSIERGLERGDSITARLARIGRNLLICLAVLVILGGATFGAVRGEVPTPAMFGVDIQVVPSSDAQDEDSEQDGHPGGDGVCGQRTVTVGRFGLGS
jgi:hypothetical protein